MEPVVPQTTEQGWYIDKSRFDFHIDPVLNQSVGGPENFYMYQLGVMGTADLWVTDHLLTTGSLFANPPITTTSLTIPIRPVIHICRGSVLTSVTTCRTMCM